MATKVDDVAELILRTLRERGSVDSYDLSAEVGKDHQLLVGAIKSLQSIGDVSKFACTARCIFGRSSCCYARSQA